MITPAHAHMQVDVSVSAGVPPIVTLVEPGVQGPVMTGTHGCGAPDAALTAGFDGAAHIANGGMLVIGAMSATVAAGSLLADTRRVGSEVSGIGAAPKVHRMVAVETVSVGIPPTWSAVVHEPSCSRSPERAVRPAPSGGRRGDDAPRSSWDPGYVLHDVDESLRRLLRRDVVNGSEIEVAFDAPTTEWAARQNVPAIDVYLYDIRENLARREVMYEEVRGDDGRVVARRPPPRKFDLSYLVTAWTQRPEDEHRLLSACLGCFLRYEVLPEDVLTGALADQIGPMHVRIALPPAADRNISDVWAALGGELKPSLDLVLTAPFVTGRSEDVGAPVLEGPMIRLRDAAVDGSEDDPAMARRRARAASESATRRAKRLARDKPVVATDQVEGATDDDQPGRRFFVHELESP